MYAATWAEKPGRETGWPVVPGALWPEEGGSPSGWPSSPSASSSSGISLPNKLYYVAEKYAEKHGLTRNELYTTAVSEFIKKGGKREKQEITRRINEICDDVDTSLNPQFRAAAKRLLSSSEW